MDGCVWKVSRSFPLRVESLRRRSFGCHESKRSKFSIPVLCLGRSRTTRRSVCECVCSERVKGRRGPANERRKLWSGRGAVERCGICAPILHDGLCKSLNPFVGDRGLCKGLDLFVQVWEK